VAARRGGGGAGGGGGGGFRTGDKGSDTADLHQGESCDTLGESCELLSSLCTNTWCQFGYIYTCIKMYIRIYIYIYIDLHQGVV